jgi:hypothetical protein
MISSSTIRILGAVCMLGGLVFTATGVWEVLLPSVNMDNGSVLVIDRWHFRVQEALFGLVCAPAFFGGQLGYYLAGAAGRGWLARIGLAVGGMGAAAYAMSGASTTLTGSTSAWHFVGVLLGQWIAPLILGVAAVFVRRVPVWKRAWPVWVALAPHVLFPLYISVLGWPRFLALATSGVNWTIFGYAVLTEGRAASASSARPRQ